MKKNLNLDLLEKNTISTIISAGMTASGLATVLPIVKNGGVVIGKKHKVISQRNLTTDVRFEKALNAITFQFHVSISPQDRKHSYTLDQLFHQYIQLNIFSQANNSLGTSLSLLGRHEYFSQSLG